MILALSCLLAQQVDDPVYRVGNGVSAPTLVRRVGPGNPLRATGTVVLSIEVAKDGRPENVHVIRPLNAIADHEAVEAVRQWTFRAGMKDGKPARVLATVEVPFRGPNVWTTGDAGVSGPQMIMRVEPVTTNREISGTVILSIEVSEAGRAEEIRILKGIDPLLDQSAVDAVKQWRFRPGKKDGKDVRVAATVEVNFPQKR